MFDRELFFMLLLPLMKLTKFQLKEFTRYWFDLSKVTFGSLILKFFEPQAPRLTPGSLGVLLCALTLTFIFAILGLRFSRGVKKVWFLLPLIKDYFFSILPVEFWLLPVFFFMFPQKDKLIILCFSPHFLTLSLFKCSVKPSLCSENGVGARIYL